MNRRFVDYLKKTIERTLVSNANNTSSTLMYQPQSPKSLEKFRRVK